MARSGPKSLQAARKGRDWFLILGDPNSDETVPRLGIMTKWVWRR